MGKDQILSAHDHRFVVYLKKLMYTFSTRPFTSKPNWVVRSDSSALSSGMLTVIFIWMYRQWDLWRWLSATCFSGVWGSNAAKLGLVMICNQSTMDPVSREGFLVYNVTREEGTWEIRHVPSHKNSQGECQFGCIFFVGTAQFECFVEVTPPLPPPLFCFVFERWLPLRNDVCILVCLMLACTDRHDMEMFR